MIMLPFPCVVPLLVMCFYLLSVLLLLFMLFFGALCKNNKAVEKVFRHSLCQYLSSFPDCFSSCLSVALLADTHNARAVIRLAM